MSTAIEFENISKQYRLGFVSSKTLSHDLSRWWTMNVLHKEDPYLKIGETNDRTHKGESDYVWALKDINFKVEQGDVLGIIGKNGAGKSTLLKILSRVTTPSTGRIRARGRIASLLEVGTGFHQEMTGRENIFMNGAIMGMTKTEIARKLDEIVDFSGCERYLDTPVKRYSSGMMVRLGFAVAAHLDPEILVVDEVLAVGDAEFQKKAIGKMQDISHGEGRTVLFVSHNMGSISSLCNNGVILSNGGISYTGNVHDCINRYISDISLKSVYNGNHTSLEMYYKQLSVINDNKNIVDTLAFNESIGINVILGCNKFLQNATFSFTIYDSMFNPIFTAHHSLKENVNEFTAWLPQKFLLPGSYYMKPILHIPDVKFLDSCDSMLSFTIEDSGTEHSFYDRNDFGVVSVNVTWVD